MISGYSQDRIEATEATEATEARGNPFFFNFITAFACGGWGAKPSEFSGAGVVDITSGV